MGRVFKLSAPASRDTPRGNRSVINLSTSFLLTAAQFSVLDEGLTFIPSTDIDPCELYQQVRSDMQQYHRRVKLAVYFRDHPPSEKLPFTYKSSWVPPEDDIPLEVARLVNADLRYYHESFRINRALANLLPEESEALRKLIQNKNIVIKPADKGSAVVIMDRSQYIWEGHRQLHDTRYYSKLEAPIYTATVPMIVDLIYSLWRKKYITYGQRDYLLGDAQPRPRLFYMLPKIHKEPVAWSEPFKIPPGRPIVSDCSSETYHTAEYLDHYLYPLSISHASYVKDTYDFVTKVRALRIPAHAFLFTMDVGSLFSNIDIAGGMRAVRDAFNLRPDVTRPDD